MIEQKSINTIDKFLGQFMTPKNICDDIVKNLKNIKLNSTIIEPSFGSGNFIQALLKSNIDFENIIGIEIDSSLYEKSNLIGENIKNINFYDFDLNISNYVHFIGNVPFRTPALSLKTHKSEIKRLCKKYNVSGIREESIFFILKTIEIIENSKSGGRISYIVPKSILTSNSKFYKTFHNLLEQKFNIIKIEDLPKNIFDNASLDTCLIDLEYDCNTISTFLKIDYEYWDYRSIFKRTYLGSVPCESIFLSAKGETKEEFKTRLVRLFNEYPNNLLNNLKHDGMAHLKVLNSDNQELVQSKLQVISTYIQEIKNKFYLNFNEYLNTELFYKEINHRKEKRWYFRTKDLKKCSFVYEINPNPCESFYFTGNPSSTSTDYFGYCNYDITRNSSPGACRTIPIDGLEYNLSIEFKKWWDENISEDYNKIFNLFIETYKSKWYKEMKKRYKRFYFGIPKDVDMVKKLLKNSNTY